MEFIYIDESYDGSKGDVFVMFGLMVNAFRLRKKTNDMKKLLDSISDLRPSKMKELKTSRFINGKDGWSAVDPKVRNQHLKEICEISVAKGDFVVGIAMSKKEIKSALKAYHPPFLKEEQWLASAMYIVCLIQKNMQDKPRNKGNTVCIVDDQKRGLSYLCDELNKCDSWYDGLYQKKRNKKWVARKLNDRFNQIINSPFAIDSKHSSLVQAADAICYVYRRHLELLSCGEQWPGERSYYTELFKILESARIKLGQCPDSACTKFYEAVKYPGWKL